MIIKLLLLVKKIFNEFSRYFSNYTVLIDSINYFIYISVAVKSIEQEYIEDGILDRISEKYNLSQENIDEWYSVILKIIKTHLRYPESMVKVNDFKQCLQELR